MEDLKSNGLLDKEIEPQQENASFKLDRVDGSETNYAWKLLDPKTAAAEKEAAEKAKAAAENDIKAKGFEVSKNSDGGYTITKFNKPEGSSGKVEIPSKVGDLNVTKIDERAFAGKGTEWKEVE